MAPGQVSKSINKIESKLGMKIFKRSASGMLMTGEGLALADVTAELLAQIAKIEGIPANRSVRGERQTLAIGATSFLTTHFITPVVCELSGAYQNISFRFLDLAPQQLVPAGLRGAFDVAIHYGRIAWPKTWTTEIIGSTRWELCVRRGHKLSSRSSIEKILDYDFVAPTYWTPEGLEHGNDQFPVRFSKRRTGYETATAEGAIPVLLSTDQIAFLPALLVSPFVATQQLRVISCSDVKPVERDLYISARSASVPHRFFNDLKKSLSMRLTSPRS
jgi:DNA-binding transcriptional LysR family regulator